MGNTPSSERVARELAPLRSEPEQMREAWQEAQPRLLVRYGRGVSERANPEPWQTAAPAPFLTIEGSNAAVWVAGKDHFRVTWAGEDHQVQGYPNAQALAHELAGRERRGLVPKEGLSLRSNLRRPLISAQSR